MDQLADSATIKVKQQTAMKPKFNIEDAEGKKLYQAKYNAGVSMTPKFGFEFEDLSSGNAMMDVKRSNKKSCLTRCYRCEKCCEDVITCEAPSGNSIGYVKLEYNGTSINFSIRGTDDEVQMLINGPTYSSFFGIVDVCDFKLMSADGSQEVGLLRKESRSFKQSFTKSDNYTLEVPKETDVKIKSLLVVAALFIDLMAFS